MRLRVALNVLRVGAIAIVLAATTYKPFDLDRYFVPKELVLHACAAVAALLCLAGCKRLTLSAVDVCIAGFLAASVVSASSRRTGGSAERALAISVLGRGALLGASALRREGLVRPLLVALAVRRGRRRRHVARAGVRRATEFFSLNRAPGGTFGNRNFVAHLCAIGTPVVMLVALTARRGFGTVFGGVAMAIVAAALVLSRSRAAWLAVLVLAVPVTVLALATWSRWCEPRTERRADGARRGGGRRRDRGRRRSPTISSGRATRPFLDSATGLVNYKEGSGHGRLVQYGNSLRMTAAHPLLGVGPGNWPVAYPKYATRNDPSMSQEEGVTSNPWPSSDWVAYLSERGVDRLRAAAARDVRARSWRALRDRRAPTPVATPSARSPRSRSWGRSWRRRSSARSTPCCSSPLPTFFVWTLAGALAPPADGGRVVEPGVRRLGPVLVRPSAS